MRARPIASILVATLLLVSCGGDVAPDEQATQPAATEQQQVAMPDTADDVARAAALCAAGERIFRVRWALYEDEFDEGPEEVQALMAELDALHAEYDRLMPAEARPAYAVIRTHFVDPLDALTVELGWSPSSALNSSEANEIFRNEDIWPAIEEHEAFMDEYCFVEEDLDTPTDPITFGDTTIVTYNSTTTLNTALTWGLERFALAGLDVPPIASATFTMQSASCEGGVRARYRRTDDGVELEFCMDEWSACGKPECTEIIPGWHAVVLHEIAHAWLDANLDAADEERFLAHVGLETWRDHELPWDQNGVEHAADTMAWGLMDRDIAMLRIGQPTTEQLADGFRILTGIDPLPRDG